MAINGGTDTGATQDQLLVSLVDRELEKRVVLPATATDVSSLAMPGYDQIKFPQDDTVLGPPTAQNIDGETATPFQDASLQVETLDLNQHVNLPYAITDRAQIQNKVALKAHYAEQAGRKMAQYIDDTIYGQMATLTTGAFVMTGPADALAGTAASVSIADITEARRLLDRRNIPMEDRFLVISPEQEKAMLNIENFIHADKYGSREALLNGEVGRVCDLTVIKSNAIPAGEAYVVQKEWLRHATQSGIKFEEQRGDVTLLRDEFSFSMLWGFQIKRSGLYGVKMTDV